MQPKNTATLSGARKGTHRSTHGLSHAPHMHLHILPTLNPYLLPQRHDTLALVNHISPRGSGKNEQVGPPMSRRKNCFPPREAQVCFDSPRLWIRLYAASIRGLANSRPVIIQSCRIPGRTPERASFTLTSRIIKRRLSPPWLYRIDPSCGAFVLGFPFPIVLKFLRQDRRRQPTPSYKVSHSCLQRRDLSRDVLESHPKPPVRPGMPSRSRSR